MTKAWIVDTTSGSEITLEVVAGKFGDISYAFEVLDTDSDDLAELLQKMHDRIVALEGQVEALEKEKADAAT